MTESRSSLLPTLFSTPVLIFLGVAGTLVTCTTMGVVNSQKRAETAGALPFQGPVIEKILNSPVCDGLYGSKGGLVSLVQTHSRLQPHTAIDTDGNLYQTMTTRRETVHTPYKNSGDIAPSDSLPEQAYELTVPTPSQRVAEACFAAMETALQPLYDVTVRSALGEVISRWSDPSMEGPIIALNTQAVVQIIDYKVVLHDAKALHPFTLSGPKLQVGAVPKIQYDNLGRGFYR